MLTSDNRKRTYTDPSSAQNYNANNALQVNSVTQFLSTHINSAQKNSNIFDIGSGDGKVTLQVAEFFNSRFTTGIDISRDRVRFARKHYHSRSWFFSRDAAKLNKTAACETYDIVTSFNSLHHLPEADHPKIFQQMETILKPNGQVFLLVASRSPELHDALDETANSKKWKAHFNGFINPRVYRNEKYYSALATQAGFSVSSEINKPTLHTFANRKAIEDFIHGWSPHVGFLKLNSLDALCDQFLKDVSRRLSEKIGNPDGTLSLPQYNNELVLRKPGFFASHSLANRTPTAEEEKLMDSGAPAMNTRKKAKF